MKQMSGRFDNPLIVYRDDIKPERSLCGYRQRMVKGEDGVPASLTYLSVSEAECHYHKQTTEYYYVLEGEGTIKLDDRVVELRPHTLVCIPPGVKHVAAGDLKVLVIGIPPFNPDDQFKVEQQT